MKIAQNKTYTIFTNFEIKFKISKYIKNQVVNNTSALLMFNRI